MTHHFLPDGSQAYVFTGRITRQRAELRVRGGSVSGTLDLDLAGDTGETAHFEMPLVTNLALPGDVDDYTVEVHVVVHDARSGVGPGDGTIPTTGRPARRLDEGS